MKNRWWLAVPLSPVALVGVWAVTMGVGLVLRFAWHIVFGGHIPVTVSGWSEYPWWLEWDAIGDDGRLAVLIALGITIIVGHMKKWLWIAALGWIYLVAILYVFFVAFVMAPR